MAFTVSTPNSAAAWRPDVFTFQPADVLPDSLYLTTTTVAGEVEGDAPSMRVAFIVDDEATVVAEAAEIPEGDPALSEVTVHTSKVSMLVRVTNEQYGQNGTANQLAQSVGRSLTRKADQLLVSAVPPAAASTGLLGVAGVVNGGEVSGSLDGLVDLVAELQSNLASPTAILLDPVGWAEFRKLKTGADRNDSLIGAGTTDAASMLLSLPVIVNPALPSNTGLVIDRNEVVSAVGAVKVSTSADRYFESDSIGLRATWRVGHAVPRPNRIGKFTIKATAAAARSSK